MKNKKRLFRAIFEFLAFILIMGFLVSELMGPTYAELSTRTPDVVITIDENGNASSQGSLFGNKLWYPDKKGRDGVIRIYNNYRNTKLTSLGVNVTLGEDYRKVYLEEDVYQSFLNHMRLTIKRGRWFEFGETAIVDDKSLGDLLNGITLGPTDQLSISASNPLDLKYTMRMDEAAGNELQSISADVSFTIKTPITDNDEDKPDDNDKPIIKPIVEKTVINVNDIDGHWAHDCILTLLEEKIIEVDENGKIRPDDYLTRAETAMLLGKALGLEPKDSFIPKYVDTIPEWAKGYVNATTDAKVFKGYPFGYFRPDNNITREEMMAVLARAFKITLDNKSLDLPFEDKDDIGDWALEDVKAGFEDLVIVGYPDNTYKPDNNITRAEAFTIVCKLLKFHETHLQKVQ